MKMKSSWGSAIERNIQPPRPTDAKVCRCARAAVREFWLLRTGRGHDPDDPDDCSSSMLLFFGRNHYRDPNARPLPAARLAPPCEAARRGDKHREAATTPMRKIRRPPFSVRITLSASPAARHMPSGAVGCMPGSAASPPKKFHRASTTKRVGEIDAVEPDGAGPILRLAFSPSRMEPVGGVSRYATIVPIKCLETGA
jgi:hypothetical protein